MGYFSKRRFKEAMIVAAFCLVYQGECHAEVETGRSVQNILVPGFLPRDPTNPVIRSLHLQSLFKPRTDY